jgi:hypothetical protein
MATNDNKTPARKVSLVITIVIDSVPSDEVAALEEQAFQIGDEWGARVNVSKAEPRGQIPQS